MPQPEGGSHVRARMKTNLRVQSSPAQHCTWLVQCAVVRQHPSQPCARTKATAVVRGGIRYEKKGQYGNDCDRGGGAMNR
mmetsp:Transcript_38025/g.98185  ORF Transcript_38025/g.98185 Transcript_38025/m.98185 type:complete len:80 (+) Transcript_38025:776-1015(+)